MRRFLPALLLLIASPTLAAQSQWVYPGPDGKLAYKTWGDGNRIMDFSFAGYMGGGVKIPDVPAAVTIQPGGTDDSTAIQKALDSLASNPLDHGFRGAVVLGPGTFHCSQSLTIRAGGIVLRGSGVDATIIQMTGSPHVCVSVGAARPAAPQVLSKTAISDAYVPSGTMSIHVQDASGLAVGDSIVIVRPDTPAWVAFMGMDHLVRNGRPEHWISGDILTHRTIAAISANQITLDVPITDCFDAKYLNPPGSLVEKVAPANVLEQVGIENFHIVSPLQHGTIDEAHNRGIAMNAVRDSWIRDLKIDDTVGCVSLGSGSSRVTVQRIAMNHTTATDGAAKPASLNADGTQILFDHCTDKCNSVFYFVTGAEGTGPFVLLNCVFHGDGHVQPHQRWSTGLLVDNCQTPEGGIDFMNRGEMGSGHGWTIGWAVAWNCHAQSYTIQQPPGTANWAIGCVGRQEISPMGLDKGGKDMPQGMIDSQGTPVAPESLYLEQLSERLGPGAVKNIGY